MSGTLSSAGRVGGIGSIHINGVPYDLLEFTWSPSNVERETATGMNGVHGYIERPRAGFIQAKLRDNSGMKVADFAAMSNADVVGELANGKTVYGQEMWCTQPQEVNNADGTFDVRFEGTRVWEG